MSRLLGEAKLQSGPGADNPRYAAVQQVSVFAKRSRAHLNFIYRRPPENARLFLSASWFFLSSTNALAAGKISCKSSLAELF